MAKMFFYSQVIMATVSVIFQVIQMPISTDGLSLSFFICFLVFCVLNLLLSLRAVREVKAEDKASYYQAVFVYAMWILYLVIQLVLVIFYGLRWNEVDTVTITVVALFVFLTLIQARWLKLSLTSPWIKCALAICFKCIPTLGFGFTIYLNGSTGVSMVWVVLGHFLILSRVFHIGLLNKNGWNQSSLASFVSELLGEVCLIAATIAVFL